MTATLTELKQASKAQAGPPAHLPQLDALRAGAALAVFGYHAYLMAFKPPIGTVGEVWVWIRGWEGLLRLVLFPFMFGNAGVPVFFVLSGFCIHYGQVRSGKPLNYRAFVWRRFWRLYPAYLVAMIAALWLGENLHVRGFPWKQVVVHLLMIHNLSRRTFFGLNGVLWTLAVEWQFYLAYPLVLFAFRRLGLNRGVLLLTGISVAALTGNTAIRATNVVLVLSPLGSWGQWCLGAWLAERYLKNELGLLPIWPFALCLIPALWLDATSNYAAGWDLTFWALFAVGLLTWAIRRPRSVPLALVWMGAISYSFYLYHGLILVALLGWRVSGTVVVVRTIEFAIPLTVAVSTASYLLVESPGVWLGKYWWTNSRRPRPLLQPAGPCAP